MLASKLLERVEYRLLAGQTDIEVTSIENDSRKVKEGSLFFCIRGAVSDGHDFIPQVLEAGAKVLVVEKEVAAPAGVTVVQVRDSRMAMALIAAAWYGHPAERLRVIGVTACLSRSAHRPTGGRRTGADGVTGGRVARRDRHGATIRDGAQAARDGTGAHGADGATDRRADGADAPQAAQGARTATTRTAQAAEVHALTGGRLAPSAADRRTACPSRRRRGSCAYWWTACLSLARRDRHGATTARRTVAPWLRTAAERRRRTGRQADGLPVACPSRWAHRPTA